MFPIQLYESWYQIRYHIRGECIGQKVASDYTNFVWLCTAGTSSSQPSKNGQVASQNWFVTVGVLHRQIFFKFTKIYAHTYSRVSSSRGARNWFILSVWERFSRNNLFQRSGKRWKRKTPRSNLNNSPDVPKGEGQGNYAQTPFNKQLISNFE